MISLYTIKMIKLKRIVNHLVIVPALLLASCGYISDKPVQNIDVYKNELQTCKIDVSKLGEIFSADQKQQIKCLQENFVQFTKYVRAKHPGAITEAELGIFVKKFFTDQSDAIVRGLSLIFQLNMILLKDEADRISHSKITPLFELLVQVNQEAVTLTNIIKTMDDDNNQKSFWDLRLKFNESTARFAKSAVGVIENAPGLEQKLNMRSFIRDMSKKIGDHEIDNDTIDSFIYLKKVLVGGDEEILTTNELKELITKLPRIMGLVFDVYYSKGENFNSKTDEIKFYLEATRNIYHSIQFDQIDFELMNSKQLVTLAEKILTNYDVESFKPSIEALKQRFIGGKKDSVTLKDLQTVIEMVHDFAEKLYFNHVTYDDKINKTILSKNTPITDMPYRVLNGYDVFPNKVRLAKLHASFNDTAMNFRYFRDYSSGSAIYDTQILRNKDGFNEVNLAKWVSWKLLKAYGHLDAKGEMQLSMNEFSKFLLDAKPLLAEFKLWSPNFTTFSRNAVLLADLFQQNSNGDQLININEATEYIGMLLTAVEVSGKFSQTLAASCDPGLNPADPVFDTDCFNNNFYEVILSKLGYEKSLPRLDAYFKSAPSTESLDYVKGIEGFARDNNSPGIPIGRRDTTLILGAMINIESTFIRFDTNNDNIIDYDELSIAFLTYRSSIISLAGLKPEQEKYAKGIFLYMSSRMEIPKTGTWLSDVKFSAFNSCVQSETCRKYFLDPVEAKRLNIGKLLYYMVNQTPSAAINK
jgi:hypothetical protein